MVLEKHKIQKTKNSQRQRKIKNEKKKEDTKDN